MMKKLSRRDLLRLTALGGVGGLVATYLPGRVRAQTAAPTTEAQPLAQNIAKAADAFLAALDQAARTKATYAFTDAERVRWHWTTPAGFPRNGVPLGNMTEPQKALALTLLRVSTSEAGYKKALDIMALQKELNSDPTLYFVTVFGTPGAAEWGWRFEGHHLSRQFTFINEQISMTPFFLGAWPTFASDGTRAMPREEDAANELVNSLTEKQRAVAIFQQNTLNEHITSNKPKVEPLAATGIPYNTLTAEQQKLVVEIITTYLAVLPEAVATQHYERISKAGLDNILFGWAGTREAHKPHYYRLQGPTFLLEFDDSRNDGKHIHSVWRVFDEDFGANLI